MKKKEGQKAIKSSTAYIKQPCKFIYIANIYATDSQLTNCF